MSVFDLGRIGREDVTLVDSSCLVSAEQNCFRAGHFKALEQRSPLQCMHLLIIEQLCCRRSGHAVPQIRQISPISLHGFLKRPMTMHLEHISTEASAK